jgi:hypothetical protein
MGPNVGSTSGSCFVHIRKRLSPNHALEPTAASGRRRLAVPSSLRASAAAQRERWARVYDERVVL